MIRFKYILKPINIWKVQMHAIYPSFVGLINVVFCLSMIMLLISMWSMFSLFMKILVLILALYFPIIHPLLILLRCIKQVEDAKKDIELEFNDNDWKVNGVSMPYSNIKVVCVKYSLGLIYLYNREAYIVDSSMTDVNKLISFLNNKIK